MIKYPRQRMIFLLSVTSYLIASCARAPVAAPEEEKPPAPVKAVSAQKVSFGGWTELLGVTQPLPGHTARVSAPVEGHVLSVLGDDRGTTVIEGQQVNKDQVIIRLDDRIVRANREKVLASLDELAQQKKEAASAVKLAQLDVERLNNLAPLGTSGSGLPLVSRLEREKARIAHEDAVAKQQGLNAKEHGIQAELQALDLQLDFYSLRAPIAGRLGTVQAMPGQMLSPGTTVAEIIDLSKIDVLCMAPPAVATRLATGQHATWKQESAGPMGEVAYVAVQALPETGSFPVKVRFPNPDLRLRANAVVRVDVLSDPEKERLSVPEAALLEDQDPPKIIVIEDIVTKKNDEGLEEKIGKAHKLQIRTGIRDRNRHLVEIISLEDPEKKTSVSPEGLLFIIEGGHGLQDDDVVKLQEDDDKKDDDKKDDKKDPE